MIPPHSNATTIPNAVAEPFTISPLQDTKNGLVGFQIRGPLDDSGWSELGKACANLSGRFRLLDFSPVTQCHTSLEEAAAFGRSLVRSAAKDRPIYLMVVPGDLLFGLCRMVQMTLDTACLSAGVFRTIPAALLCLEQNQP